MDLKKDNRVVDDYQKGSNPIKMSAFCHPLSNIIKKDRASPNQRPPVQFIRLRCD